MKRKICLLIPAMIGCFSLVGCDLSKIPFITVVKNNEEGEKQEEQEQEENTPIEVDQSKLDKYYSSANLNKTGGKLFIELQRLMFSTHTQWNTYSQVNTYYSKTKDRNSVEAVADGSNKNQWFYTGKEASGYGTREHVWPCANSDTLWAHGGSSAAFSVHNVDLSYYTGGGSDLYHVRTCNSMVNTARGNAKYVDFDDVEFESLRGGLIEVGENNGKYNITLSGATLSSKTGNYEYADKAEPADEMKGDIARIVTYVYLHYKEIGETPAGSVTKSGHEYKFTDMTGALSLTQIMGYDTEDRCKEVLKAWNKLDAPSNVEKLRNETVQKIQGNRNPFVDYPRLMDQLFEN